MSSSLNAQRMVCFFLRSTRNSVVCCVKCFNFTRTEFLSLNLVLFSPDFFLIKKISVVFSSLLFSSFLFISFFVATTERSERH